MPLGGSDITWDEATPPGSESIGLGDDRIRSLKSSVRLALDSEHNFPAAGSTTAGYHRLGSARAHVGTQSRVSSGDTDGRLMVTSDTTRFFGVGSGGTALFGDPFQPAFGSASSFSVLGSFNSVAWPQRYQWAMESGYTVSNAQSIATVPYPNSGFSFPPLVFLQEGPHPAQVEKGADPVAALALATSASLMTITALARDISNGSAAAQVGISWLAIGLRTL